MEVDKSVEMPVVPHKPVRPWSVWLRLPDQTDYMAFQGVSVLALMEVIRIYSNPKASNVPTIRIDFGPIQVCPTDVV